MGATAEIVFLSLEHILPPAHVYLHTYSHKYTPTQGHTHEQQICLITTDEYEQSKTKFKMKNNITRNKKQTIIRKQNWTELKQNIDTDKKKGANGKVKASKTVWNKKHMHVEERK